MSADFWVGLTVGGAVVLMVHLLVALANAGKDLKWKPPKGWRIAKHTPKPERPHAITQRQQPPEGHSPTRVKTSGRRKMQ